MPDEPANAFERGQLKREAIDWWIKMHDVNAHEHRDEFNRWLQRGAIHRSIYNRVSQVYGAGKKVDWDAVPPPQPVRATARMAVLAVVGAFLLAGFVLWRVFSGSFMTPHQAPETVSRSRSVSEQAQLLTGIGDVRRFTLPDGSRLTLDTDTLVTVDYRRQERELRLEHGRARFDVAHETRPFVVDAGDNEVVAHGTIFDVALLGDRDVQVHLLRGSVVVRRPEAATPAKVLELAELHPGEAVTYPVRDPLPARIVPVAEQAPDWPGGLLDVAHLTLGAVTDAANRYSTTKIVVGDDRLRAIPVSGTFRINDPAKLAKSLSLLFGLRIVRQPGQYVLVAQVK